MRPVSVARRPVLWEELRLSLLRFGPKSVAAPGPTGEGDLVVVEDFKLRRERWAGLWRPPQHPARPWQAVIASPCLGVAAPAAAESRL